MDVAELGGVIRDARKAVGMSQEDLGHLTGMSRVTINYAERGRVAIGADALLRLAGVLGLSITSAPTTTATPAVQLLAQQASVSYRESIPAAEVEKAFITGTVPRQWLPHIATILDEASDSLLLRAVREIARDSGTKPTTLWSNIKTLAAFVSSPHPRWHHE